jgi:hypothetical protein
MVKIIMKNMFKRSRKLVIGLLIMLSVMVSGFTYAYWASAVNQGQITATGTVTLGEGNAAATTVTVGNQTSGGPLVPVGRAAVSQGSAVEFVVLQFSVVWSSDIANTAIGAAGTLAAVESAVLINGVDTHAGLVNLTIRIGAGFDVNGNPIGTPNNAIIVDGSAVIVYVKVTLTEPSTQAIYNAVAGKNITFTMTFTATPN